MDTAQLSEIMDWQRLARAISIPFDHVSLNYFCSSPLRIVASIQGNQSSPYQLIIDQEHGIFHDCPDFQRPHTFCKHLGRLTSLLPREIQNTIITLFEERGRFSKAELNSMDYVNRVFTQNKDELLNLDFLAQIQCIIPYLNEDTLLYFHLEHILCDWMYLEPHTALKFMDSYPQLIPLFQKMLKSLRRPIPACIETCFSDSRYSILLQNSLWDLLNELFIEDSIELNNGLQIIL